MAFIYTDGAVTPVTRPSAPTNLSLDDNDVAPEEEVKLSWKASVDGICNPVNRYDLYKDGQKVGWTSDTEITLTSPSENGSASYSVCAIGAISALSSEMSESVKLTTKVSKPSQPQNVTLSLSTVSVDDTVKLSWTASNNGDNNEVKKYHIYRGEVFVAETTGTEYEFAAPTIPAGANSRVYNYTVQAVGAYSNSDKSRAASLTVYEFEYQDYYYTYSEGSSAYNFTVPGWAVKMDVCCIGGGGSGGYGGGLASNYNATYHSKCWGSGAGGGGTGEKEEKSFTSFSENRVCSIVVGKGGGDGAVSDGTESSFVMGNNKVSAAGGKKGGNGQPAPADDTSTPVGGTGGSGGIGGNGGGLGWGRYSYSRGENGDNGESTHKNYGNWSKEWYVFSDATTGKRLGCGGCGGWGYDDGKFDSSAIRNEIGRSVTEVPGTMFGGGGRGGDQTKTGIHYDSRRSGPQPGQHGLVAVRCYRYVR